MGNGRPGSEPHLSALALDPFVPSTAAAASASSCTPGLTLGYVSKIHTAGLCPMGSEVGSRNLSLQPAALQITEPELEMQATRAWVMETASTVLADSKRSFSTDVQKKVQAGGSEAIHRNRRSKTEPPRSRPAS